MILPPQIDLKSISTRLTTAFFYFGVHDVKQYLQLLNDVFSNGKFRSDRTGTGTLSVFGRQIRCDLAHGFPLLTTKKLHFKSIATELEWFLNGYTYIDWLKLRGVSIWDEWATDKGDLGPIYGRQWTAWPTKNGGNIDQIRCLIDGIINNAHSRRLLFSAWNCEYLPDESISPQDNVKNGRMALAPCHVLYQFYIDDNKLSSQVYLRSSDIFLGLPYNIASLALLTHWLANLTFLEVGEIVVSIGDLHLYRNHVEQANIQLTRKPLSLPKLSVYGASYKPFVRMGYQLLDYDAYPHIKASIAI